jgi:RNA polymerase sigma factor (sigma-70 family)
VGEGGKESKDRIPAAGASSDDFEEFVQRPYEPLAKALALMTLDRQLAADVAHDAFLRLQLRWSDDDRLEDPVAWLYRVAINRSRDYRRQLVRTARLFDRLSAGAGPQDAAQPWAPEMDFSSLIERLPKQQRVAAVLFYQADLSTAEIAKVMRISEGAVKSHLFRARETLRPLVEAD